MALDSFRDAHKIAESLDDNAAETAIAKAIDDVQNRIDKGTSSFLIFALFLVIWHFDFMHNLREYQDFASFTKQPSPVTIRWTHRLTAFRTWIPGGSVKQTKSDPMFCCSGIVEDNTTTTQEGPEESRAYFDDEERESGDPAGTNGEQQDNDGPQRENDDVNSNEDTADQTIDDSDGKKANESEATYTEETTTLWNDSFPMKSN